MSQVHAGFIADMLKHCERGEHPPLTVWEAQQLLTLAQRALAASPAAAPQEPARVYLVATGETHEGQETYTRHDTRPPLCDAEVLYASPLGAVDASAGGAACASGSLPRETLQAIQLAYGHLWHVNNEPAAPVPMYAPEKAAYQARRHLRDLLTTEQRGEGINQVGVLIGRYDAKGHPDCEAPRCAWANGSCAGKPGPCYSATAGGPNATDAQQAPSESSAQGSGGEKV